MTAAGLPSGGAGAASLSIGSVLDALRADFPEITISKIRFLESEGLISPSRTPAGYRQFSHPDVERLRFVLSAQRDHYLPLKVIRAKLEEFDRDPDAGAPRLDDVSPAATATATLPSGPPAPPRGGGPGGPGGGPGGPHGGGPEDRGGRRGDRPQRGLSAVGRAPLDTGGDDPDGPVADPGTTPVSREALLSEDGVDEALLAGLEHHGILRADVTGRFEPEAPMIVRTAAALAQLGVEPRLLRGARASADREVGLLNQLLTPVARSRGPEAGRRAGELSGELAALSGRLHALLVGAGLRGELRR